MITLTHYLLLGTLLFGIGLLGVFAKRNAVAILMCVELMLNAVNINLVAVNRFVTPANGVGQLFSVFIIVVAAAEVSVGLALIISIYRQKRTIDLNNFNVMKW